MEHPIGIWHIDEHVGSESAVDERIHESVGKVPECGVKRQVLRQPAVSDVEVGVELGDWVRPENVLREHGLSAAVFSEVEILPVAGAYVRQLPAGGGIGAAEYDLSHLLLVVQLQRYAQRLSRSTRFQQYFVHHNQHTPSFNVGRAERRYGDDVRGDPGDEVVVISALSADGLYQVDL
ncbi:pyruvate kinase, putative [Babesia ovata]|uniref:Pyruvate kinase, putative n=1 Tax=Babesia ovata TaxID=189622 RepID=A0A2H6KBL4_9APIC|nr:pyruvate kinase, putative [Babesia ovata]GBE60381.1 pyruvate kinase, putative [Babesia ovata]